MSTLSIVHQNEPPYICEWEPVQVLDFVYSDVNSLVQQELLKKYNKKYYTVKYLMLDICGITEEQMPKLFESYETVGTLKPELAEEVSKLLRTIKNKGRMTSLRKLFREIPNLLKEISIGHLSSELSLLSIR